VVEHCAACHAQSPSSSQFSSPPAGMVFESGEDMLRFRNPVIRSVESGYMPLGNPTGMTDEERQQVVDWMQAQ